MTSPYPPRRTGLGRRVADIVGSVDGEVPREESDRILLRPEVVPLDVVPFPMLVADALGRVLAVNGRWVEVSGLSREASLGIGWQSVLDPDDRRALQAELTLVATTGAPGRQELGWPGRDGRRAAWWLAPRDRSGEQLIGLAVGEPLAAPAPFEPVILRPRSEPGRADPLLAEVPVLLRSIDALLATLDRLADRLPTEQALPA